ncbi:hypothetical protein M569_04159, partial [Genlisea aurea]
MRMPSLLNHSRPLACLSTARLVPSPPDLVKWIRREGGFLHDSVRVSPLEDEKQVVGLGLGLVALDDIAKGTELIALPPHIPLRFECGARDDDSLLVDLARHIPEELWQMKLGLKLLQERARTGSFWWPYISNLPETFSVPIFFSGEDIKELQYAPLVHQVNKRCRFLHELEKVIKCKFENVEREAHPFGGQKVDASSLGWAMSAVSSRAFRLHGIKQRNGSCTNIPMLLPLIDMCNHSFTPNAEIVQETEGSMLVKVIAESEIKRGDPLELNYGRLNNDLFLLDYGFIVPSNPYDCVEVKYDIDLLQAAATYATTDDRGIHFSHASWKNKYLSLLNLAGEKSDLKVRIGGSEVVEDRLLAALRILLSHDYDDHDTAESFNLDALKSLTYASPVDADAFRVLIALCVIALHGFPTKITEDEKTLLEGKLSQTTELAVRYRLQKKGIIVSAIRDLNTRLK